MKQFGLIFCSLFLFNFAQSDQTAEGKGNCPTCRSQLKPDSVKDAKVLAYEAKKTKVFDLMNAGDYISLEKVFSEKENEALMFEKDKATSFSVIHVLTVSALDVGKGKQEEALTRIIKKILKAEEDQWFVTDNVPGEELGTTPVQTLFMNYDMEKKSGEGLKVFRDLANLNFKNFKASFCHRGVWGDGTKENPGYKDGFAFAADMGIDVNAIANMAYAVPKSASGNEAVTLKHRYGRYKKFFKDGKCS